MVREVGPSPLRADDGTTWDEPTRPEGHLRRSLARLATFFRRAPPAEPEASVEPAEREPDALDALDLEEVAFFGLVVSLHPGFVIVARRGQERDAHLVVLMRNTGGTSWTGRSMCAETYHGRTAPRPRGRRAISRAAPPVSNGLWVPVLPAQAKMFQPCEECLAHIRACHECATRGGTFAAVTALAVRHAEGVSGA